MYHWINDKELTSAMKSLCARVINETVQLINSEGHLEVKAHLVGSGEKNLITQNEREPIDLDYNLEILDIFEDWNCKQIKNFVRNSFDKILNKYDWGYSQDSTSSLTTEKTYFNDINNKTKFSIDLAIICIDEYGYWYRLINDKRQGGYKWEKGKNKLNKIEEKSKQIRVAGLWEEVRKRYLSKKNKYLTSNDYNHSSFVCYIEAVNETYQVLRTRHSD